MCCEGKIDVCSQSFSFIFGNGETTDTILHLENNIRFAAVLQCTLYKYDTTNRVLFTHSYILRVVLVIIMEFYWLIGRVL